MKLIKKTALLLCATFMMTGAFAQTGNEGADQNREKKTPQEKATHVTEKMQADLELSDAQTAEVAELNKAHFEEMETVRAEMKKMKKKAKELRKQHEENLKSVLTDEQYTKHQAKMEERKKKRHDRKKCAEKCTPDQN